LPSMGRDSLWSCSSCSGWLSSSLAGEWGTRRRELGTIWISSSEST
jgi:hypothetical protein